MNLWERMELIEEIAYGYQRKHFDFEYEGALSSWWLMFRAAVAIWFDWYDENIEDNGCLVGVADEYSNFEGGHDWDEIRVKGFQYTICGNSDY